MKPAIRSAWVLLAMAAGLNAQTSPPTPTQTQTSRQAGPETVADLLNGMGKTLSSARQFSFEAQITFDTVADNGQKIQIARSQSVQVRRPDGIRSTLVGDDLHVHFLYDGKTALFYNVDKKSFARVNAPATIDQTLDMLANDYGLPMQLADFLFADPAKTLTEQVSETRYIGRGRVNDEECDHLAFRQETVDWQVWISRDAQPLPRKLVITYKNAPGAPQFTAYLSNWNTKATNADAFRLDIPADATPVDLIKRPPSTSPAVSPAPAKE